MVDVYAVKLNHFKTSNQIDQFSGFLSTKKREKINRFKIIEDAERSLMGGLLTRFLLCQKLNLENDELVFGQNDYGKPYLISEIPVYFNISHSGAWAVCVIASSQVGIDVEEIKPIDFSIAKNFFSHLEYLNFTRQCKDNRLCYFYKTWCAKESYSKAIGKGLAIPLHSYSVDISSSGMKLVKGYDEKEFNFQNYQLDEQYELVVCANEGKFGDMSIIPIEKLLNFYREEVGIFENRD